MILDELLQKWFFKKQIIRKKESRFFLKTGEIWLCYFGINVGQEWNGSGENFLRPILVIKKITQNVFIGLPLTSQMKSKNSQYRYTLEDLNFLKKQSFIVLDEFKTFDKKRLYRKLGQVPKKTLKTILKKSVELTFMNSTSEPQSSLQKKG